MFLLKSNLQKADKKRLEILAQQEILETIIKILFYLFPLGY